jgi:hypothetical protein
MIINCEEAAVRSRLWLQMKCHLAHVCEKGASQQKTLLKRTPGSCIFRNVFDRMHSCFGAQAGSNHIGDL